MKARGKRWSGAKRVAPGKIATSFPALKERHNVLRALIFCTFSALVFPNLIQGRRASLRSALAPGFHIAAPLALRTFTFWHLKQSLPVTCFR